MIFLFGVIQTIENIWLRPRILGNSLKIHPALVFIGVMGSLGLAGVFLTLIIVPLMGTAGKLWNYIRARMLGLDPWPDLPMTDQAFAHNLIEESLRMYSIGDDLPEETEEREPVL